MKSNTTTTYIPSICIMKTHSTSRKGKVTVFQKSYPYSQVTLKCSSHSSSISGLYWIVTVFHMKFFCKGFEYSNTFDVLIIWIGEMTCFYNARKVGRYELAELRREREFFFFFPGNECMLRELKRTKKKFRSFNWHWPQKSFPRRKRRRRRNSVVKNPM